MADKIDKAQVEHIAHLARLKMTPEEITRYQHDLSNILNYFDQLNELDTENVEPTAHPLPVQNVLREDELHPSYKPDQALRNAPGQDGTFFVVPKVLDQEGSS